MSPVSTEEQTMQITTMVEGDIEIKESQIIEFVQPLIGFEGTRRFVILQTKEGPLYWLQSVDNPQVAFALLAPFQAGLDPDMPIGPSDATDIGASSAADISVYTVLVLDADPDRIRTNLRAPILVCDRTNRAKQAVLDAPHLPVQFFLKNIAPRG